MSRAFYVTTPIYYPNADPHIGTAYSLSYADTLARFHRARGEQSFLLTGTDEHGEKIAEAAGAEGIDPKAFVDRMAARFRSTWDRLGLRYDYFIRTTDDDHRRAVQHFWQTIHDRGDVEFRDYEGRYCVGCERYLTERELKNGLCEQHNREPEIRREANYFFRMSRHFEWFLGELEKAPERVEPERFRNEAIATLRSGALEDLCITRPRERLSWGIPAPWDADRYTMYVWADALVSYLTACGYPDKPGWEQRWAAAHHLIAKDILKPHAVFWPAMLHAAGVPLYHRLLVHGYWTVEGQKVSKTLGTAIHPLEMDEKYGYEPFRYFMLREMSFGLDADFSHDAVVRRINSDLANDLGNLLSRTLSMLQKYRGWVVPAHAEPSELAPIAERAAREVERQLDAFHTGRALGALWELVSAANRLIDTRAPWKLAKEKREPELDAALYEPLEALRVIAVLLGPFLPKASLEILASLDEGVRAHPPEGPVPFARAAWGGLAPGTRVSPSPKGALFPRMEAK